MTPRDRVLIAGVGNIFLGDDAFGVEVVRLLQARALPDGVRAVDFGIRALDLASALRHCDAAILVDAMPRGGAPGTLYVVEPALGGAADGVAPGHGLTPESVLSRLAPGAGPGWLRVVGCEPSRYGEDSQDEAMELSEPVRAALSGAVALVEQLVAELDEGARRA